MPRPRSLVKPVKSRLADGTIVTYYYDRRTGAPLGTDLASALARASALPQTTEPPSGSLAYVIVSYLRSPEFRRLRSSTKEHYRRNLTMLRCALGDRAVRSITSVEVQFMKSELQDHPGKANAALALLSIVMNHARRIGMVDVNPAAKPGRIRLEPRTELWSLEEEDRVLAALRASLKLAFLLLLYTMQRPSDVLAMTVGQVTERDGRLWIRLRQQKTEALIDIPLHSRLVPFVRERLATKITHTRRGPDGIEVEVPCVLLVPSPTGLPWPRRNFSRAWDRDLARANETLRQNLAESGWSAEQIEKELKARHRQRRDLRRTGIVRMAEAGATVPQISAISGHKIDYCQGIIDTYLPRRSEVAAAGMDVWERAQIKDSTVVRLGSVTGSGKRGRP